MGAMQDLAEQNGANPGKASVFMETRVALAAQNSGNGGVLDSENTPAALAARNTGFSQVTDDGDPMTSFTIADEPDDMAAMRYPIDDAALHGGDPQTGLVDVPPMSTSPDLCQSIDAEDVALSSDRRFSSAASRGFLTRPQGGAR